MLGLLRQPCLLPLQRMQRVPRGNMLVPLPLQLAL